MKAIHKVVVKNAAAKAFKALSKKDQDRVAIKIGELSLNRAPIGSKKIVGKIDMYRIRFGDWRMIYSINTDDNIITILLIARRSNVYKLI